MGRQYNRLYDIPIRIRQAWTVRAAAAMCGNSGNKLKV